MTGLLSSRLAQGLREAFATPLAGALSLAVGLPVALLAWGAARWLVLDAVWPWQDAAACSARDGICWPFLVEKTRFILFGTYPYDLHARPAAVSVLLCGLCVLTGCRMTGKAAWLCPQRLAAAWSLAVIACFVLMGGGVLGLEPVDPVRWNGLPILLLLSIVAVALAFPRRPSRSRWQGRRRRICCSPAWPPPMSRRPAACRC